MRILTALLSLTIGVGSVACTASMSHDVGSDRVATIVTVEPLHASQQCGREDTNAKVTWVTDDAQLSQVYQGFKRNLRGSALVTPSAVDFSRDVVVLVEMGRRPTLGYGLVLNDAIATIVQGHVEVVLEWREPSKGMMVGQMLTSPCVLIKLQRGDYREVWIKDTQGRRRAVATMP